MTTQDPKSTTSELLASVANSGHLLQAVNDLFRKNPHVWPLMGQVVMTHAVSELRKNNEEMFQEVMNKVLTFDQFTEDNDPYGEHDYASFSVASSRFFFKIDYYDENYEYGCAEEDRTNPDKCRRVLTVGYTSDY